MSFEYNSSCLQHEKIYLLQREETRKSYKAFMLKWSVVYCLAGLMGVTNAVN